MMKAYLTLIMVFCSATCSAWAAEPDMRTEVVLERTIDPSAGPIDIVLLRDVRDVRDGGSCRFVGELVREPSKDSTLATKLLQLGGMDSGVWHVAITRRVCREKTATVNLRADLPLPPSLAGGGGIPAAPMGYQAGTKFSLVAN